MNTSPEAVADRPGLLAFVLVPLGYFLGARFGVEFTVMPEGSAILWPPNSLLLATLLRYDGRGWLAFVPLILLAEVAADVPTFSVAEALLFATANLAEASIAFVLLRRSGFDPGFRRPEDLAKFILAGPVIAAFFAAVAGAATYSHFRGGETGFLQFLAIWWSGDALGLLILTPMILRLWLPGRFRAERPPVPRFRRRDAVIALAGGVVFVLTLGVVPGPTALPVDPILLLPFVLHFCARFGVRHAALIVGGIALALIVLTTRGWGPFPGEDPRAVVTHTQEYLFILVLVGIGIAEFVDQYRRQRGELERANARLERRVAERTDQLRRANDRLEARVADRTERLRQLDRRLRRYAMTDPLTGLPNRRAMVRSLQMHSARARRMEEPLIVLLVDIDDLKSINDRHGHSAGDAAIRTFSRALARSVRTGDVVARSGGDEFVVFGVGRHADDASHLAERILEAVRARAIETPAGALGLTASIGGTTLDVADGSIRETLRRADDALYRAKEAGRDRFAVRYAANPVGEALPSAADPQRRPT